MFKKFFSFFLALCLLLAVVLPVHAADDLVVNNMEIDIWPEYDQPSTLIIYRASFTSLTSFPAKVSFKIPASAGSPYSVSMKDLDGILYDLQYTLIPDGDWNRIEFITSTPDVQIEFYDAYETDVAGGRGYSFRWVSDYPINYLKMVAQQPRYASSMTIEPSFGKGVLNKDDGLIYFTTYVGAVNLGESINVNLGYQKSNNELSASILPVKAVDTQPVRADFWQTLRTLFAPLWENSTLLIAAYILIAGILLILALMALSSRRHHRLPNLLSSTVPVQRKRAFLKEQAKDVYCHVCGKHARPGDIYCRACGSKLLQK